MSDTTSEPNASTEDGRSVSEKHGHIPQGGCRICGISKTSLAAYLSDIVMATILEGLKILRYKGQPSRLLDHKDGLEVYFGERLPRTTAEAQDAVE